MLQVCFFVLFFGVFFFVFVLVFFVFVLEEQMDARKQPKGLHDLLFMDKMVLKSAHFQQKQRIKAVGEKISRYE